jgi:uncharacterized membrane protein YqjE
MSYSRVSSDASEETLGGLVHRLSEQLPELIRSEIHLAQAELAEKGKKAGVGIGMFSVAGLLAFFGLAVLVTTAILALALALPAWASALVVAAVLLAGAGLAAVLGRNRVQAATPPKPELAMESVRLDVAAIKGDHR